MKLYLNPSPFEKPNETATGISRVVAAMNRFLPQHGIELVPHQQQGDIHATHVLSKDEHADVLHCHGLYPTGDMQLPRWAWDVNARVVDGVRHAMAVTVPSSWVAELFMRNMGFAPRVIGHGLDIEEWPEPSGPREMTVLWNKNRNQDVCSPDAIMKLAEMHPDVQFASTFGESRKNVLITGLMPHAQMRELLYASGIYFAYTKETFGIGIIEAMAAGMPVLAWNWGNVPELVKHYRQGYLVEPYDYEGTSRGLDYCMKNFDRLSASARERALKYTWEEPIAGYAATYQEVLSPREGPKISVIVPCFNYMDWVGGAIESMKAQTYDDWECIVVNDGSTDGSLEAIHKAVGDDPRFTVIDQPNSKVAAARNRGALASRGEYVCFLDADDALHPQALEKLLPPLEVDRSIGISFGGLTILMEGRGTYNSKWPGDPKFDRQLRRDNQVPTFCMIRREAFTRAGGYKAHTIPTEDAELWTRIGTLGWGYVKATQDNVLLYRMHNRSASYRHRKGEAKQVDWNAWIPEANGALPKFASISQPANKSHPVFNIDKPVVSFITPVGDGHEDLLMEAIESVTAQVHPRWEHIVIDDTTSGGLKNHAVGAFQYGDRYPHIHWLRLPVGKRHNVARARNAGARVARGKYLCFLDADDMLHREFLWNVVHAVREFPEAMIYTDWVALPNNEIHTATDWSLEALMKQAIFAVTFVHPKAAWEAVGGMDEEVKIWEDWDYMIRLALAGYCGVRIESALFAYRYETGTRREKCLENADELIAGFQARYKGIEPMPCCGKRRGRTRRSLRSVPMIQKRTTREASVQAGAGGTIPNGMVLVRLVGDIRGTRIFKGPSGQRHRFGGVHIERLVPKEDADYYGKLADFAVVGEKA